ncbi:MAG: hypothetical protein C0624_02160 [Desulfuromonas sp.]|nr:MAG: hypothetical protein C0624_02160 [Desulfuromonas sp.]
MGSPVSIHMPGRYVSGDSLLHRLDPRSKLLSLTLCIVVCFVSQELLPLAGLTLLLLVLFCCSGNRLSSYIRLLRSLRYLFAFTLLVYLLLTPGYTLFGLPWLSREGLVAGGLVCLQLSLAFGFSLLISSTTHPTALATGIERLASPLKRFGVPVALVGDSLRMVMYFLDMMLAEWPEVAKVSRFTGGLRNRIKRVVGISGLLLEQCFEHADEMAGKLSRGESLMSGAPITLSAGFGRKEWTFLVVNLLYVGLLLELGP